MQAIQQDYLKSFIHHYNQKTQSSKQKAAQYQQALADSRRSAGFRLSTKELSYPIVGSQGNGAYFWDIDQNKYIDISMGFGALLFGHMPEFLRQALQQHILEGIQLGPQAQYASETAELICQIANVERVAYCNTGTEAIMTALRLARLKTNRQKVVIFTDSYHGFYDATLALPSKKQYGYSAIPLTDGLPEAIFQDVIILPYLEASSLETLKTIADNVAAILVEPVRGRFPQIYAKEFLLKLREIADHFGTVLIFDEIVTGFRCHMGGAQAYFGINADLVTYGKALAGGLPIGVVAGRADILCGIDGGTWYYEDASFPQNPTTFFAGTFNKNPFTITASYAVLKELKRQGNQLQQQLTANTEFLTKELNQFFHQEDIAIQANNFSSLFRFDIKQSIDIFFYHLIFNNVYAWEGRSFYLSTEHQIDKIKFVIDRIKESALILKKHGFI